MVYVLLREDDFGVTQVASKIAELMDTSDDVVLLDSKNNELLACAAFNGNITLLQRDLNTT